MLINVVYSKVVLELAACSSLATSTYVRSSLDGAGRALRLQESDTSSQTSYSRAKVHTHENVQLMLLILFQRCRVDVQKSQMLFMSITSQIAGTSSGTTRLSRLMDEPRLSIRHINTRAYRCKSHGMMLLSGNTCQAATTSSSFLMLVL